MGFGVSRARVLLLSLGSPMLVVTSTMGRKMVCSTGISTILLRIAIGTLGLAFLFYNAHHLPCHLAKISRSGLV